SHSLYLPSLVFILFFLLLPRPPTSTLFPYTTLFRSRERVADIQKALQQQLVDPRRRHMHRLGRDHPVAQLGLVARGRRDRDADRSEEHTSELQSRSDLVCRLLLEKKKKKNNYKHSIR